MATLQYHSDSTLNPVQTRVPTAPPPKKKLYCELRLALFS